MVELSEDVNTHISDALNDDKQILNTRWDPKQNKSFIQCILDYADYGHGLASGSEDVLLEPYDDSFSCDERTYGYYGDVNNNCQVWDK